jgi:hypothetical protein
LKLLVVRAGSREKPSENHEGAKAPRKPEEIQTGKEDQIWDANVRATRSIIDPGEMDRVGPPGAGNNGW